MVVWLGVGVDWLDQKDQRIHCTIDGEPVVGLLLELLLQSTGRGMN